MGRPWRNGLTDVALGAAGIAPILDHRGELDPYGNELHLTQMAVIDELAAAAELVKGKCDQVPVAVVRGYLARHRPSRRPGRGRRWSATRPATCSPSVRPRPARPDCATPPGSSDAADVRRDTRSTTRW